MYSFSYYNENYEQYDKEKTTWDKRLNKKWTPKPITGQHDILDLNCVADINKTIQLWMGYISKQLIDNKIVNQSNLKALFDNLKGESFFGAALIGNLGAVVGSIVSTRLMMHFTKKML